MSPVCFVTEVLSTLRSSAPRARKGVPRLPRFACAALAALALSILAALPSKGGRDPSPCSCYPPPSPGGVRHVHAAFNADVPKQMPTRRNQHEQRRQPPRSHTPPPPPPPTNPT